MPHWAIMRNSYNVYHSPRQPHIFQFTLKRNTKISAFGFHIIISLSRITLLYHNVGYKLNMHNLVEENITQTDKQIIARDNKTCNINS